jgi:hypothetical protein
MDLCDSLESYEPFFTLKTRTGTLMGIDTWSLKAMHIYREFNHPKKLFRVWSTTFNNVMSIIHDQWSSCNAILYLNGEWYENNKAFSLVKGFESREINHKILT